jgi:hypothetical protein
MREVSILPKSQVFGSSQAFTIMEVALAATVLAFTLMGMIGVVESGAKMLDLSRKQTIATQILHSEIDQLRLQSWTTITGYTVSNSVSSPFTPGYGSLTTLTTANDPTLLRFAANLPNVVSSFTLTRTVACVQPTSNPNTNPGSAYSKAPYLIQVTFTITWTGITGQSYTRTSTTYVGYNGLYQAYQRS